MFCPGCGAEVSEGRSFCGKCGAKSNVAAAGSANPTASVVAAAPARTAAIAPHPAAPPLSPVKRIMIWLFALLMVSAGGAYWWWSHRPIPAYKISDPGIYPFLDVGTGGKPGKWGFVDADGKIIVQPEWDAVNWILVVGKVVSCNEDLCPVQNSGKWGFINTSGQVVISPQFDNVGQFVEGLAAVHLGNQIGYIDKTGHYIINPQFDIAGDFHSGLAAAHSDGAWGFINKTGTFVIKPQFQSLEADGFAGGPAPVCSSKCGYIDRDGTFAIRPQFEEVTNFSEGLAGVRIGSKWGYVDTSGNLVINPQFDSASMFSGDLAVVTISGRAGTIDKKGNYVLNPGQYNILQREDSVLSVTSSGGIGLITRDGKWIIKPTKALIAAGPIFDKVFLGVIVGQPVDVPISTSGKVLIGLYKGASLDGLAQDIQNAGSALQSMQLLVSAETSYSGSYPAKGFTAAIGDLGPATATPDENHAGLINSILGTGTKDGYQFTISIPPGTSTGGANFNYFLVAKPVAGHFGRTLCADSSGAIHQAEPGEECTTTSPTS